MQSIDVVEVHIRCHIIFHMLSRRLMYLQYPIVFQAAEEPFNDGIIPTRANCTSLMELHTLIRDTLITYRGSNDIIKTQEQNVYAAI